VDIFIVIFNIADETSFNKVTSAWIPEIIKHGSGAPYIICGNKLDLRYNLWFIKQLFLCDKHFITFDEGVKLAREVGATSYVECSAKYKFTEHVIHEAIRAMIYSTKTECVLQ